MTSGRLGAPPGADFQGTCVRTKQWIRWPVLPRDCARSRTSVRPIPRCAAVEIPEDSAAGDGLVARAGESPPIDAACIAAIFGFVFLGAYGIGRSGILHGRSAGWGLGLPTIPAVVVSLARITPDVAPAALCCWWALFADAAAPRNPPTVCCWLCQTCPSDHTATNTRPVPLLTASGSALFRPAYARNRTRRGVGTRVCIRKSFLAAASAAQNAGDRRKPDAVSRSITPITLPRMPAESAPSCLGILRGLSR
jgi:hypothetical protein